MFSIRPGELPKDEGEKTLCILGPLLKTWWTFWSQKWPPNCTLLIIEAVIYTECLPTEKKSYHRSNIFVSWLGTKRRLGGSVGLSGLSLCVCAGLSPASHSLPVDPWAGPLTPSPLCNWYGWLPFTAELALTYGEYDVAGNKRISPRISIKYNHFLGTWAGVYPVHNRAHTHTYTHTNTQQNIPHIRFLTTLCLKTQW